MSFIQRYKYSVREGFSHSQEDDEIPRETLSSFQPVSSSIDVLMCFALSVGSFRCSFLRRILSQSFSISFAWQLLANLSMVHPVPGECRRVLTCCHPAVLWSWPKYSLHSAVAFGAASRSHCSLKDVLKSALVAESDLYPAFSCLAVTSLVVPDRLRLTCPGSEAAFELFPRFALRNSLVNVPASRRWCLVGY